MSLYNAMFGVNPMAGLLLQILGIKPGDVPRLRDAWLDTEEEEEKPRIVVFTRTGGGNRSWYDKPNDEHPGPYNEDLRKVPGFIKDEDDSYDSTYALFYFNVPVDGNPELPTILTEIRDTIGGDSRKPSERFKQVLADLREGKDTEDVKKAREVAEKIAEQIHEMLRGL